MLALITNLGTQEYAGTNTGQATGQVVTVSSNGDEVGSTLGHATRVSPATVSSLPTIPNTLEWLGLSAYTSAHSSKVLMHIPNN